MKKIVLLLFAALLILFAGCQKEEVSVQAEVQDSAPPDTDIAAFGEVLYGSESQIGIDFPAQIESIDVEAGDFVSEGTKLITLSIDAYEQTLIELQAKVDIATASSENTDYAALQEQISVLKKQITYRQAELSDESSPDLKMLQTSLSLAQTEAQQANEDLENYKALLDSGAISKSEYSEFSDAADRKNKAVSDIELNIAKTKRALQETIDSLNVSLKTARVQLSQQKAGTQAAQASLVLMKSKTDKPYISGNTVVSDLAHGIVKKINVQKGTVLSGQTAQTVITVIDADSIYVNAEVPEEFIGEISEKSRVFIVPTSDQDVRIAAHIVKIPNMAVDVDGDRIINIKVMPDENSPYIKPGFTAEVYFSMADSTP